MNEKFLQSKCREILVNYEDVIKTIIFEEKEKINKQSRIGETSFETVKKTLMGEGTKAGLDRVLELINKHANKQ